jgi:hypothetical protein
MKTKKINWQQQDLGIRKFTTGIAEFPVQHSVIKTFLYGNTSDFVEAGSYENPSSDDKKTCNLLYF